MQKIVFNCCLLLIMHNIQAYQVKARATQHEAMPLLLVTRDEPMVQIVQLMKHDLSFTGHFKAEGTVVDQLQFTQQRKQWKGTYPIVVFISCDGDRYQWQLFDTSRDKPLRAGHINREKQDCRAIAHALADKLWHALTSHIGFFSTRIAYCKEVKGPKNRTLKHIYVADFDGSNEQVLVDTPTVNIGPRWNTDLFKPLIFYSEFTDANVRMVYVDMAKQRHIACDFEGVNMLPAFSPDGTKAVFCASHARGNCQLYYVSKGKLKQLTSNAGNNFCPTLSEDGNKLYFCSDYGQRSPSIYSFDLVANSLDRIPNTVSSESPCYCSANKKLAYCKAIKGYMQLFVYDTTQKKHKQLTFNRSAKQGASWSPCGNYLLYAQEEPQKSLLCMMHVPTGRIYTICESTDRLSFPAWSPRYKLYPVV